LSPLGEQFSFFPWLTLADGWRLAGDRQRQPRTEQSRDWRQRVTANVAELAFRRPKPVCRPRPVCRPWPVACLLIDSECHEHHPTAKDH
jgi:hypothetical protein